MKIGGTVKPSLLYNNSDSTGGNVWNYEERAPYLHVIPVEGKGTGKPTFRRVGKCGACFQLKIEEGWLCVHWMY